MKWGQTRNYRHRKTEWVRLLPVALYSDFLDLWVLLKSLTQWVTWPTHHAGFDVQ